MRDKEGKPYSVRYDQVNAMLLNEFLKEHRKVEQQRKDFEAALALQQKQIEALTGGLQKVSAQLELRKPAPQTVLNNPQKLLSATTLGIRPRSGAFRLRYQRCRKRESRHHVNGSDACVCDRLLTAFGSPYHKWPNSSASEIRSTPRRCLRG